jgi:uncharacterized protein (DUF885 family)
MKKSVLSLLGIVLLVTVVVINFSKNSAKKLQEMITTYQDHESYDGKKYPLGLFTKEYYESEANFATDLLNQLENINLDDLNENDLISYELLKFELNDIIDYFYFERYLNPLLSDSGFHSSLNYMVRPLSSYKKTIEYLNKLNSLPEFVDQNLTNIREGLEKGVSQPLVIFYGYE